MLLILLWLGPTYPRILHFKYHNDVSWPNTVKPVQRFVVDRFYCTVAFLPVVKMERYFLIKLISLHDPSSESPFAKEH